MISHTSYHRPTNPSMSSTQEKNLVRYVEIWQAGAPSSSSLRLISARSLSPGGREVDHPSVTVAPGEGIAGSAWKQNAPVIIRDRDCVMMREAQERSQTELLALVAVPFVNDRNAITIVVFGLGEGYGGLEVWARDDRDELSINGSYYHGLNSFEFISQYVRFPRGSGLPGSSWKSRRPKMVKDPGVNADFIRSFAKDPADLTACVGIPVTCKYGSDGAVLLVLSSAQHPFARKIDILTCESRAPTKEEVLPPVRFVESQSTDEAAAANGTVGRMQATCDRLAESRDVLWLKPGDPCLSSESNGALLVPFFDKNQISSVLQLSF